MLVAKTPRVPALLCIASMFAFCVLSSSAQERDKEDSSPNILSTPPLLPGTNLACVAANVGKTPVTVDIEMHDATTGAIPFRERCELPPGFGNFGGNVCAIERGAPLAGYCTFTVVHGNKKDIRGAILSENGNLGVGALLGALPAQ